MDDRIQIYGVSWELPRTWRSGDVSESVPDFTVPVNEALQLALQNSPDRAVSPAKNCK